MQTVQDIDPTSVNIQNMNSSEVCAQSVDAMGDFYCGLATYSAAIVTLSVQITT
jgi:hypothetical protein